MWQPRAAVTKPDYAGPAQRLTGKKRWHATYRQSLSLWGLEFVRLWEEANHKPFLEVPLQDSGFPVLALGETADFQE